MADPYEGIGAVESDPYQGIGAAAPDYSAGNIPAQNAATDFGGNTLQVYNPFGKNLDTGVPLGQIGNNVATGVGKLYSDAALGARQLYGQMTGGDQLQQQAADKRATDADISGTPAGKIGEGLGALPLAFVPGVNSYYGAAAVGGALGALTPTTQDDSRVLNTGFGAAAGLGGKYVGDNFGAWLRQRAAQPFLGWNLKAGNQAAAQAVGSAAPKLNQQALGDTADRLGGIFTAARDPAVTVPLSGQTAAKVTGAAQGLNASSRQTLESNPEVMDLMSHLRNGSANAQQLGSIASNLGTEANRQMTSQMGDRQLGKALFSVKEHVDDLIGQSITDPTLAADYAAARPQYRLFTTLQSRPTLLNSTTGDVNLRNLGNYLQKTDKAGFAQGGNTSPLYEAARYGQRSTIGSRPPPPILQPFKWAAYHGLNNPVVGAITGAVSRLGAPISPAFDVGLPALGLGGTPVSLSYLEN